MKTVLLASANPHKVAELKRILQHPSCSILSFSDIGFSEEIPETGSTYAENAAIKASTVGKRYTYLTVADDSGIEVDALDGRPGVYSARYVPGTDADRVQALLHELRHTPQEKRTARYQAVIAVYNPDDDSVRTFSGTCEGCITAEPKGNHGFGYDPVFYSFDLKKTFAEATAEEKQQVSHRSRALSKAKDYLAQILEKTRPMTF